jgi:hypothetical protein
MDDVRMAQIRRRLGLAGTAAPLLLANGQNHLQRDDAVGLRCLAL